MEITNQVGNQGNISSIQKNTNNVKNIKNLKAGELAALEKLSPKEKSRTQFLEKFEREIKEIAEKIASMSGDTEGAVVQKLADLGQRIDEFANLDLVATYNAAKA